MEKSKNNRKLKLYNIVILLALFIACTISIMHPDYVYAASSETNAVDGSGATDINGTDSGAGSNRTGLYYAGSVFRSGFLFMVVNNDGKPITYKRYLEPKEAEDNGIELYDAVTFRIVQPQLLFDLENTHIGSYVTHFGEVNSFSGHVYEDAPAPIKDNGSNWSGNSKGLEEWLFKQRKYSGKLIDNWQYIVLKELSEQSPKLAGKVLKELMIDEEINLAIEPISIQTGYDWSEWSEEDWNTNATVHSDKDATDYRYYLDKENNFPKGKPFIVTNTVNLGAQGIVSQSDRILKVCSTGMYSATLIHRIGDAIGRPVDDTGGKNRTWLNETLPFCVRLESDQLGITAVGDGSPVRLPHSTISNPNLGYALILFRSELKDPKIHTYDVDTNPSTPNHAEIPSEEKGNNGEVTIKKVYYTYKYNSMTSSKTVDAAFETKECTNVIQIMDEEKETGYKLQNWGTSTNDKLPGLPEKYKTLFKVGTDEFARDPKWDTPIYRKGIQNGTSPANITLEDTEKYIYLLYCKTEKEPEPEYSDSNWEIPESYLTKSAYFSSAKSTKEYGNLQANGTSNYLHSYEFKWTSDAHVTCGGHICCRWPVNMPGMVSCHDRIEYPNANWKNCNNYKYTCNLHGQTITELKNDVGNSRTWTEGKQCPQCHIHTTSCYGYTKIGFYPVLNVKIAGLASKPYRIESIASNKGGLDSSKSYSENEIWDYIISAGQFEDNLWSIPGSNDTLWLQGIISTDTTLKGKDRISFKILSGSRNGTKTEAIGHTITDFTSSSINLGKPEPMCGQDERSSFTDEGALDMRYCQIEVTTANSSCHHYDNCTGGESDHDTATIGCIGYLSDNKIKLGITANIDNGNKIISGLGNTHGFNNTVGDRTKAIGLIYNKGDTYAEDLSRNTKDTDTKTIKGLDYAFLLYRGDDSVTLTEWKQNVKANAGTVSNISSNIFKSQNTPQGGRAVSTYIKQFKYTFGAMAGGDINTTERFMVSNLWHLANGKSGHVTMLSPCPDDTKSYNFANAYKVNGAAKVNVFSDYAKTNGDATEPSNVADGGQITFYPYVQMFYDDAYSRNTPILVLGENLRTMKFYNYAEIGIGGADGENIAITSTQWSTHASAIEKLNQDTGGTADTSKILPGGAEFDISIPNENRRTITAKTYQVMLSDEGKTQIEKTSGTSTLKDRARILADHNQFARDVREAFSGIYIKQWLIDNPAADPFKGVGIDGSAVYGNNLSSDSKYYFRAEENGQLYKNSFLDVEDIKELSSADKEYEIKATVTGAIKVNGTEVINVNNKKKYGTTAELKSALKGDAKKLEEKTGVISSIYFGLLSGEGNDSTAFNEASVAYTKNGKWYNEAFDGITILECSTTFQIGYVDPLMRSTVLDPKLMPKRAEDIDTANGQSLFTQFYTSQLKSTREGGDEIKVTFNGVEGTKSCTAKSNAANLFRSPKFYIPNVTVQDLK